VLIYQLVFSKQKEEQTMHLLFFALILVVVHLMVEGYRWQIIPAYLSFGILYLRIKIGELKFTQRFNKLTWGLWALFAISLPVAVPVIDLPEPTGPYPIGTQIYHWIDSSRAEWFTPENDQDVRELVVQVWYPAEKVSGKPMPYLDNLNLRTKALGGAGGVPGFLASHIDLVKTHSFLNSTVVSGKQFPLLIISHGITSFRQIHTALIEALTSNGYIVAAPDHTYDCNLTVFPDGHTADYRSEITGHPDSVRIRRQQLNTRVADVRFILNQMLAIEEINKIIDFEKVGVLGHSYGGATAIQTAYEDDRFKAALCLDGWMNPVPDHIYEKGIQQPFLYLGRPRWNNSDYPTSPLKLVQFLQNVKSEKFNYILKGSRHLDFSDLPLFSPLSEFFLDTGTISSKKAVSITNEVVLLFFDRYLKNIMNHFPKSVANYSEIIINPAS